MSIRCEFSGVIAKDPEIKTSKRGTTYLVGHSRSSLDQMRVAGFVR